MGTSEMELEWHEACGCIHCVHDVKMYLWECLNPASLVTFDGVSNALYYCFVCSLAGAV